MYHHTQRFPTLICWIVALSMMLSLAACAQTPAAQPTTQAQPVSTQLPAEPEELTVAVFGGAAEQIIRKTIIEPFEKKYNAKVNTIAGLTMENLAKLRAQKDNPEIDLAMFDPIGAIPAAREGLLEKLDPARIPNINNIYEEFLPPEGEDIYFIPTQMCNQVIAYNTDYIKEPPTSWEDLWKPEYKGKVILPDISTVHADYFIALMGKMYGTGLFDTDAAFEKIETLKPNVLTFWTSHDQVAQLLNQGEAWITPWVCDRPVLQMQEGAPIGLVLIPDEGSIVWTSMLGIAKGTKHKDLAEKYVNHVLDPEVQLNFHREMMTAPPVNNVQMNEEEAKIRITKEKMNLVISPDWEQFVDIRDSWADRWNREIK